MVRFTRGESAPAQKVTTVDETEAVLRQYFNLSGAKDVPVSPSLRVETQTVLPPADLEILAEQYRQKTGRTKLPGIIAAVAVASVAGPFIGASGAAAVEVNGAQSISFDGVKNENSPTETVVPVATQKQAVGNVQSKITVASPNEAMSTIEESQSIAVAVVEDEPEDATEALKIVAAPIATTEEDTKVKEASSIAVVPTLEAVVKEEVVSAPVVVSAPEKKEAEEKITPEETVIPVLVQPVSEVQDETPKQAVSIDTPAPEEKEKAAEPIAPVKEPTVEVAPLPELDPKDATKEEVDARNVLEQIYRAIRSDGDVTRASSFIVENFKDTSKIVTEYDENNEPIVKVTNPELIKKIQALAHSFPGHEDGKYTGNALMALAVLQAAANNQDVLASDTVRKLVSDVKRPGDYAGKLYDQYLAKAKEALAADNGLLLKGFNEADAAFVEQLYTYALLANSSDEQQAKEIQAIKDEEARVAAEAARKAAEEKAAKEAAEKGTSDIEVIANNPDKLLIKSIQVASEKYNWSKLKTQFLTAAAELGVDYVPLAGLAGNVAVESAGFQPSILERGWEHDVNRGVGFVQYTNYIDRNTQFDANGQAINGRRTRYEAAARNAGFDPRNDTSYEFIKWQVKYIIDESKGRTQRDGSGNEWEGFISVKDPRASTAYFRWNFERPGVPHAKVREDAGQEIYDQIGSAMNSIKSDAEKAKNDRIEAQKAKEAEAAKYGPTFDEAVQLASDFYNNRNEYLGEGLEGPSQRVQCTVFVNYFTKRYVSDMGRVVNGVGLANFFAGEPSNDYKMVSPSDVTPFTIFSLEGHGPGHTGIVLSVEPDGSVIIVEANVRNSVQYAGGMLKFKAFGNKEEENWMRGQVNVEHWSSLDAWTKHWASWGYGSPRFASPEDGKELKQVSDNFDRGSR